MRSHRIVFVAFDEVQCLDVAGPYEVFTAASKLLESDGSTGYRLEIGSVGSGPVRSESGLSLVTTPLPSPSEKIDTLVIPGGTGASAHPDPALVDWLRAVSPRRTATVCSGALLAARAGMLDGRRVTTHWSRAEQLAREHPLVEVDPEPVYAVDGPVWSSAGVTAGIDLALAIVAHDFSAELADTVARWLVMFPHRPANQSQFARPGRPRRAGEQRIRTAQQLIEMDPSGDHRVGVLAEKVAMSERHFQRRFRHQTGVTPGNYLADVRLGTARRLLEEGDAPLTVVAAESGFGSVESLRRTFESRLATTPGSYRRRFTLTPRTADG